MIRRRISKKMVVSLVLTVILMAQNFGTAYKTADAAPVADSFFLNNSFQDGIDQWWVDTSKVTITAQDGWGEFEPIVPGSDDWDISITNPTGKALQGGTEYTLSFDAKAEQAVEIISSH